MASTSDPPRIKLKDLFGNVLLDIAISFYTQGCKDSGEWDDIKAVEHFTSTYVMPQAEGDDPESLLMLYIKLKKMVQS